MTACAVLCIGFLGLRKLASRTGSVHRLTQPNAHKTGRALGTAVIPPQRTQNRRASGTAVIGGSPGQVGKPEAPNLDLLQEEEFCAIVGFSYHWPA